jgi:hypothetical protein
LMSSLVQAKCVNSRTCVATAAESEEAPFFTLLRV